MSSVLSVLKPGRWYSQQQQRMEYDLFIFFRMVLVGLVTIYATVVTLHSLWNWYLYLSTGDRYVSLLRRYLLVHGLRLRFKAFWGDVLICLLLTVAFVLMWRAQMILDELKRL